MRKRSYPLGLAVINLQKKDFQYRGSHSADDSLQFHFELSDKVMI